MNAFVRTLILVFAVFCGTAGKANFLSATGTAVPLHHTSLKAAEYFGLMTQQCGYLQRTHASFRPNGGAEILRETLLTSEKDDDLTSFKKRLKGNSNLISAFFNGPPVN